jgi:hypothetical protein
MSRLRTLWPSALSRATFSAAAFRAAVGTMPLRVTVLVSASVSTSMRRGVDALGDDEGDPCRAKSKCYRRGYHRAKTPVTEDVVMGDAGGRCGRPCCVRASNDLVGARGASPWRAPSTGRVDTLGRVRSLASW